MSVLLLNAGGALLLNQGASDHLLLANPGSGIGGNRWQICMSIAWALVLATAGVVR